MTEDQKRCVIDARIERSWRLKEFINALMQLAFDIEETITVLFILQETDSNRQRSHRLIIEIPEQEITVPGEPPEIEQAIQEIVLRCNRIGP